jgi:hypothetical protein
MPAARCANCENKKGRPRGTALVIGGALLFLGGLLGLDDGLLAFDVGLTAGFFDGLVVLFAHKCLYIFSLIAIL